MELNQIDYDGLLRSFLLKDKIFTKELKTYYDRDSMFGLKITHSLDCEYYIEFCGDDVSTFYLCEFPDCCGAVILSQIVYNTETWVMMERIIEALKKTLKKEGYGSLIYIIKQMDKDEKVAKKIFLKCGFKSVLPFTNPSHGSKLEILVCKL